MTRRGLEDCAINLILANSFIASATASSTLDSLCCINLGDRSVNLWGPGGVSGDGKREEAVSEDVSSLMETPEYIDVGIAVSVDIVPVLARKRS